MQVNCLRNGIINHLIHEMINDMINGIIDRMIDGPTKQKLNGRIDLVTFKTNMITELDSY